MKTTMRRICAAAAMFAATAANAASYKWTGKSSREWNTTGNWSVSGNQNGRTLPTNDGAYFDSANFNSRYTGDGLVVTINSVFTNAYRTYFSNCGSSSAPVVLRGTSAANGLTSGDSTSNKAADYEGIYIGTHQTGGNAGTNDGNLSDGNAYVRFETGTYATRSTYSYFFLGNNSYDGHMTVAGATINPYSDFKIFSGSLTIESGIVNVTSWTRLENTSRAKTINLNGGTLHTYRINKQGGTGAATVNFNGGTLRIKTDYNSVIDSGITVNVKANGGTIDVNGTTTSVIPASFSEDSSSTGGGMKFCGGGTLTLGGSVGWKGGTTIAAGTTLKVDTAAKKDALLGSGLNTLKVIPPTTAGEYALITITGSDEFSDSDLLKVAVVPGSAGAATFSISNDRKSLMLSAPYIGGEISQSSPTLVFPGASLADLATHTLRARMQGGHVNDKGVEVTFFNRVETVENDVLTKVTYQLQALDGTYVKCVYVDFTADANGVYAKLADGNYGTYSGSLNTFGTEPITSNAADNRQYYPYDFRLVPAANAISVNFNHTDGNMLTTSSSRVGAGDYAVPYASWNNMSVSQGSSATFGGATFKQTKTSGQYKCSDLNKSKDLRYGYLDDSGLTVVVDVTNIPYEFYRIVTYHATDNADLKFGHVTINGVNYTGVTDATVKGDAKWGATGAANKAKGLREGVNYLVSDVMSGSSVTITGHRDKSSGQTCRGCIAAIQIVEYVPTTYTATIDDGGSKSLSALSWDNALPALLTANDRIVVNVNEDTTLDIDIPVDVYGITFNVAAGKTLTLSGNNIASQYITATGAGKTVVASASQLSGIVKGDGTLVYDGVRPTTTGTDIVLTNPLWTGMVVIKGYNKGNSATGNARALFPQFWGSANSKIKWNGVFGYFGGCTSAAGWILEDLEDGGTTYPALTKNDGGSSSLTTAPSIEGTGTFADASNPTERFKFANADNFTGTISITSAAGYGMDVQFGATAVAVVPGAIHVLSGATVTIADGQTWAATAGIVLNGTLMIGAGATAPKIAGGTGTVGVTSGTGTLNGYDPAAVLTLATAPGATLAIVDNTLTAMTVGAFNNMGTIDLTGTALTEATLNLGSGVTAATTGTILYPASFEKFVVSPADQTVRSLADFSTLPTLPEGAAYYVTLSETREEFGKGSMIVTNCAAGVNVRAARPNGTVIDFLSDDGTATLSEAAQIAGAATAFDFTYTNTAEKAYAAPGLNIGWNADTKPLTFNNSNADKTTGAYIKHHPWVTGAGNLVHDLDNFSIVLVGSMSPSRNTQFFHMGTSASGGTGLLITTTENDNEVLIAKTTESTVDAANGVKASVPNAATARHAYVINKKGTVFEVWVDGVKRGQFDGGEGFSLSAGGMQVGSDHGGTIGSAGIYQKVPVADGETGTLNVLRMFDYTITEAQAEAVFNAYPYVSEGGLYTRTVAADGTFSETDAWAKDGDANLYAVPAGATVDDVFYNPSATLTVNAAATLGVNADVALDTLTVGGSATLTFAADGTHTVTVVGAAIINSPVTNEYGALNMSGAPVQLGENGAICFDCTDMDVSKVYAVTRFQLTGLVDRDDEKVTFVPPVNPDRSYELVYNTTGSCYDLIVTPLRNYIVAENRMTASPTVVNTMTNIVVGAGGFDIGTLAIPENANIVLDPINTPFYVWGATAGNFTIGNGAKFALAPAYSGMTLGRIVLLTYCDTSVTLPANLNDLFDENSIAQGATFAVTCETFVSAGNEVKQLVLTVGDYDRDAKEIVVMAAGDSITQGVANSAQGSSNPQYRTAIAARLAANGYKPKFRGIWRYSDRNGANIQAPDDWAYHCGFGCAAIRTTASSGGLADNMPLYLDIAGYPDVITLLIGTNDLGMNGKTAAETFENYVALVNDTAAQRPDAKIIGATILPRPGETGEKVVAFNTLLTAEYAKSGKGDLPDNFFLVDLYPLVPNDAVADNSTGNYAADNLHPNWKGHAIIAEAFYGKIAELLPLATFAGAGDATVTDAEQTALGAANIAELADYRSGMTQMFTIVKDGAAGATNCFTSAPYTTTNANILLSRPVSKVGYYMELVRKGTDRRRWVWVDMDATGKTLGEVDFPWNKANMQRIATKLHVKSNCAGIHDIAPDNDAISGIVEGTMYNYGPAAAIEGAPEDIFGSNYYGWNDTMASSTSGGHGCFQVHRIFSQEEGDTHWNDAEVLFAWNRWGFDKSAYSDEIGIGPFNCHIEASSNKKSADYTNTAVSDGNFAENVSSDAYSVRRFEIWVKVDGAPRRGYWTGLGGDGDFDNAANWEDGVVPSSGDDLFIIPSSGTLNNNLENFAPKSITFQEGTGSVTIGGKAITGVAAITNLSSSSHVIDVPVEFDGEILVVQPAMSWEQKTEPSIRFAGGVTGTTFAEGTARYLNGYFTLSTGEGWVANVYGSNNRWGLPADSSLTTPETTDTLELALGQTSTGGAFTSGVVRTSSRILCWNYGEYVVTNELAVTLPGADKYLAHQYGGAYKFEKVTIGDQGASKWLYFANQGDYASTKNIWIGAGGLNFADGASVNTAYSLGRVSGDVVYLRPWHSDYTIATKPGGTTDLTIHKETHIGTVDENGVARTVTCNGRIRNLGSGRAIVEGSGKFIVNSPANVESGDNGTWTVTDTATLALTPNGNLGIGTATVNSNATLALPETGTVTLTGNLTLDAGAVLEFNLQGSAETTLDVNGKTLTLPGSESGTVFVNIAAGSKFKPGKTYTLVSGANLENADAFSLKGDAGRLTVEDGDLKYVSPAYFLIHIADAGGAFDVKVPSAWIGKVPSVETYEESTLASTGANGLPLWKSYCLGLDPTDAASLVLCEPALAQAPSGGGFAVCAKNLSVPAELEGVVVTAYLERRSGGDWVPVGEGVDVDPGAGPVVLAGTIGEGESTSFFA